MEYQLNEGVLTLSLPERIDTSSVATVEDEVFRILEANEHKSLVFEGSGLGYISSVGLRLILKVKKAEPTLRVENVSTEVYDIFEMTGFTQILDVRKKFREISIEGCPLIGKGAYGKVYRLSPDTIVKSYFRGNPVSDIERERNLAKLAFILGIPTAISYDIVKIKEEKLGAVYELIAADSLLDTFLKSPDRYQEYLDQYIALLANMGKTPVSSDLIPSYKDDLRHRRTPCIGILEDSLLGKISDFIESLPEGRYLCHGDCHFKNIFVTADGMILIDMDTLSKGEPFYELACLYKTYVTFDTIDPTNAMEFFGVDGDFCRKLFEDIFEGLYKDDPEKEEIRKKVEMLGWYMYVSHSCHNYEKNKAHILEATKYLEKAVEALEL